MDINLTNFKENDCYTAQINAVVNWKYKIWPIENIVFLFVDSWSFPYINRKNESIGIFINEDIEIKNLEEFYGIKIERIGISNCYKILAAIRNELSKGIPVLLPIMSKYIAWVVTPEQTEGYLHMILVVSINEEKKYALVTDVYSKEKNRILSFDKIVSGYRYGYERFNFPFKTKDINIKFDDILKRLIRKKDQSDIRESIENIRLLANDILNSKFIMYMNKKNYINSNLNLGVLDCVKSRYKIESLLNKCGEKYNISFAYDLAGLFKESAKKWDKIHYALIKASIKAEPSYSLKRISDQLNNIADFESKILGMIEKYFY